MLLVTLLVAVLFQAEGNIHINWSQEDELLPRVISNVLLRYFRNPFQPVHIHQDVPDRKQQTLQSDTLDKVLRVVSGDCQLEFATPGVTGGPVRTHGLLLAPDVYGFERILQGFHPARNDNSGRYLLVQTDVVQHIRDYPIGQLVEALWKHRIVNVNVLVRTNTSVQVYSYVPYSPQFCAHPLPVLVTTYPDGGSQYQDLYPLHRLLSLHNCTLQVGSFEAKPYTFLQRKVDGFMELGGFEGDLLRVLAHRLHFRVNVTESPNQVQWGVMGPPGNSTGTMQLVQDGLVDLVIACMALDVTRSIYLKPGTAHYMSRILFAVPQGRPYTGFEKLFRPFRYDIWAALGATLAGVAAVVGVLSCGRRARTLRTFVYGEAVRTPLLSAFYLLMGGAIVTTPRRNFARTLFGLWLAFTFVIRTLYQGSLYLYLQKSATYPPLATLDEIHGSTLHYHMVNIAMRFFVDRPEIRPRVRFIPPGLDTLGGMVADMATRYHDRVVVCPIDMVAYNNRENRRSHPGRKVYVTRESITLFPLTIYYPKQSCLTELFDREVRQIAQTGLMDFWVRSYGDYDFEVTREARGSGGPLKLTLEHLVGAYQLLGAIHLLAMVVFLLELLSLRVYILRRLLEYCIN